VNDVWRGGGAATLEGLLEVRADGLAQASERQRGTAEV